MNYCSLTTVAYSSSDGRSEAGLNSTLEPKSRIKAYFSFVFSSTIR